MIGRMQGMNSDTETAAVSASGMIDFLRWRNESGGGVCELGFSGVGIARADTSEATPGLERWLALGRHGGMDYMAKHAALRSSPEALVRRHAISHFGSPAVLATGNGK